MTVTRFQEVKRRETRSFTCTVCGKRGQKSQTFWQTLNPFNKLPDGSVKTYTVIVEELNALGAAWHPEPIHDKCYPEES